MALSQTSSSQMICVLTGPQQVILESQSVMNGVDGATIERRIRISRPDDENARCRVSNVRVQPKDFSQRTQPLTTLSTSNAISPQQERTEPSGPRRCRRGAKSSLRREPNMPANLLRALFGNVTVPLVAIGAAAFVTLFVWFRLAKRRFASRAVAWRTGTCAQAGDLPAGADQTRLYTEGQLCRLILSLSNHLAQIASRRCNVAK
jgi:hypothetical protein